jgi:serine protease Do
MRRLILLCSLVVAGFLAGLVVTGRMQPGGAADAQVVDAPAPTAAVTRVALPPTATLPDLADVAARVVPSVVNISVEGLEQRRVSPFPFFPFMDDGFGTRDYPAHSAGSGVIIGADGTVVTNAHVLGNRPQRVTVILSDRREREATLVGLDPYTDLALLRIDEPNITPITWGDSARLRVAEWVMALGNPFQLGETVTLGIVSAVGRTYAAASPVADYIQTDAAINPGNSGGALVNRQGELVGINTWIYSETGGYQGIGFAVPSNTVRDVTQQIVRTGRVQRGMISGLQRVTAVTPPLARELRLASTDGAIVMRMIRTGDAYAAGIRPGDVIVAFDGTPIQRPEDLEREMLRAPIGSVATLRVRRGPEEFDVKVPIVDVEPQRPRLR